jgi:hypothetical protein
MQDTRLLPSEKHVAVRSMDASSTCDGLVGGAYLCSAVAPWKPSFSLENWSQDMSAYSFSSSCIQQQRDIRSRKGIGIEGRITCCVTAR